jgi:hypothetical protein
MSRHAPPLPDTLPIEAGQQVAHLRHVLGLVEEIASPAHHGGSGYDSLDQAARASAAYERSLPVAQRRFDAIAQETATWAAVAIKALLAAQEESGPPRAAAAQLARELEHAMRELAKALRT